MKMIENGDKIDFPKNSSFLSAEIYFVKRLL